MSDAVRPSRFDGTRCGSTYRFINDFDIARQWRIRVSIVAGPHEAPKAKLRETPFRQKIIEESDEVSMLVSHVAPDSHE